ncbi:PIN domain-containing protein [candidate division KSB1 bacterium]|nr:PIN domain-containing protein [candidate division KSB1 bacterium]
MNDNFFLDTNIFVYAFDDTNTVKQQKSNQLIKTALTDQVGCISYQVIQEFVNVSTRKFTVPLSIPDCRRYFEKVLMPLCRIFTSIELFHDGLDIMQRWQYSFYDSLIIAAALQAGCSNLYSEDLQHGQKIKSLVISNPFI